MGAGEFVWAPRGRLLALQGVVQRAQGVGTGPFSAIVGCLCGGDGPSTPWGPPCARSKDPCRAPCQSRVRAMSEPCQSRVRAVSEPCQSHSRVRAVSEPCQSRVRAVSEPCQIPVITASYLPCSNTFVQDRGNGILQVRGVQLHLRPPV
jgi:hypothetical protein